MQAIERHATSQDWVTIILLVILLLLVAAKLAHTQRFTDFISLLTSNKFMVFKGKEYKAFHPFNILMFSVNVLSVSLFIFIIWQSLLQPEPEEPVIAFVRIATAYAAFVLLKFGIEKIIANIFLIDEPIEHYLFKKLTHRNFIALLLLPVSVFFFYAVEPGKWLLFTVVLGIIAANLISLTGIYRQNQKLITSNWFYFILYLCALEIAPYFILYKLITKLTEIA